MDWDLAKLDWVGESHLFAVHAKSREIAVFCENPITSRNQTMHTQEYSIDRTITRSTQWQNSRAFETPKHWTRTNDHTPLRSPRSRGVEPEALPAPVPAVRGCALRLGFVFGRAAAAAGRAAGRGGGRCSSSSSSSSPSPSSASPPCFESDLLMSIAELGGASFGDCARDAVLHAAICDAEAEIDD